MLGLLEGNEDQTAPAGEMVALLVCKWIAPFLMDCCISVDATWFSVDATWFSVTRVQQ